MDTELNVDLVEVYVGGSSIGASIPVGVISGQGNVPISYVSPNNWLIVRLSVDGTVGGDGWTGTWATGRSTYCVIQIGKTIHLPPCKFFQTDHCKIW